MDDWKPIESAPKDSTILLLLARVKDAPDQRPHPIVGVWLPALDQWKPVPHFLNQHAELIPSMWIRIPQKGCALHSSYVNWLIFRGPPASQDLLGRNRAEIDGLLHQPQEQQAARS